MEKAIIFDVDGTLIHTSKEFPQELVRKVLTELGKGNHSEEGVLKFWFGEGELSRKEIVEREFGISGDEFFNTYDKFVSNFEYSSQFKKSYDDVIPVLNELKKRKMEIGIVTDAPYFVALPQLNHFLGDEYFSTVICSPDIIDVEDKPSPEGLYLCMERLGVKDATYVGDSDCDILAARNAGIDSVLIDRGEHETTIEADRKIKSLVELL